jgi:putative SOS response-associated peptidase YedK
VCTNYRPGARDFVRERFGAHADFEFEAEAWPGSVMPVVLPEADGGWSCLPAGFGLIPHWARDTKIARSTYNARSETVAEKPSFRRAWRQGQRALVPMSAFFEPGYERGRAERWRVERRDGRPFAAAALWDRWQDPHGHLRLTFTLLTVNADGHAVMGRLHAPGEEKRSLVAIAAGIEDTWFGADEADARALLRVFAADEYTTHPDPLPARGRRPPAP